MKIKQLNKTIEEDTAYAFLDKENHCMCIVYGETKRDLLIKYFKS